MRTLITLCALALAKHGFSAPTSKKNMAAQEQPDDDVELEPPMEPFESVDNDIVDEEADTEQPLHKPAVLVHPAGPGGQHSQKTHEKAKPKKVVAQVKRKDPNPMNKLHKDIQKLHNSKVVPHSKVDGIKNFEKAVDTATDAESAGKVSTGHPLQQPPPSPQKPQPVVKHATTPQSQTPPVSKVSHQERKIDKATQARKMVTTEAWRLAASVQDDKLAQALEPKTASAPEPESDMEAEHVHHKGKHKKKQKEQAKRIVKPKAAAPPAPEVQKHPDLQSATAELDADLQDEKEIAPVPANVEANLEAKLETEDKNKVAEKASEEQEVEPPKNKQHGKHKHGKGKKKQEEAVPQNTQAAIHTDPLDQLHEDVHQETAHADVVQQTQSVTPKPAMTDAAAETKESGTDKLNSDTSGDTVVSISKKIAKAVESKLEHALQSPPKPPPILEVEPQAHHAHGKHHKKHGKHQDATPAWSRNSTNGDAMKALHRDTQQYRPSSNKTETKPLSSAAKAPQVAPEEKLRKDLGIKSEPVPAQRVAEVDAAPPAVHTLAHKSHKHHKVKSTFSVPNVTYKDPMAAVHHDAAVIADAVRPQNSSHPTQKLKNTTNKSLAPLAKLDEDLGVRHEVQTPPGSNSSHLSRAMGKHHQFLKKHKKEKKVESEEQPAEMDPLEPAPYNVSLMRNAIQHLDHAINAEQNSHVVERRGVRKPHIIDEDRPEGYPSR